MPKLKLTDDLRRKLARAYCLPAAGKLRSLTALGEDVNIVGSERLTAKTVQKAIIEAFERSLVKLAEPDVRPAIVRDEFLEASLESRFNKKKFRAIVVKHGEEDISGDRANWLLGHALAHHISKNDLLRNGDKIGLGTGRAVYYTAEAFSGLPNLHATNISLYSLTGSMFPKNAPNDQDYRLDADTITMSFARYFEGLNTVSPISYPMAYSSRSERDRLIKGTFLNQEFLSALTYAIIGLGTLSGDSRFAVEARNPKTSSAVNAIYGDINRIRRNIEAITKLTRKHYGNSLINKEISLVGDYCNRLFRIHPRIEMPTEADRLFNFELKADVARINNKIITATKTQLHKVGTVILVAGTAQKAPAIRAILDHPFAAAHLLVTEEDAARAVLMIPELPESRPV